MFLRHLNFFRDFFGHIENWLIKKAKVNFKIHDVTTWNQTIKVYLLLNTQKGNKATKQRNLVR